MIKTFKRIKNKTINKLYWEITFLNSPLFLIIIIFSVLFNNINIYSKESEEEKYKVEIHPTQPTTGITTGHVIAYGHYIKPPYELTMKTEEVIVEYDENLDVVKEIEYRVYINGIQVSPGLRLYELKHGKPEKPPLKEYTEEEKAKIKRKSKREDAKGDLQVEYYELSEKYGDDYAVKEIKNELVRKGAKITDSINFEIDKEKKKIKISDVVDTKESYTIDIKELKYRGLRNKQRIFLENIRDEFLKNKKKYGAMKANQMLDEEIKKNSKIIEDYKLDGASLGAKFKEPDYSEYVMFPEYVMVPLYVIGRYNPEAKPIPLGPDRIKVDRTGQGQRDLEYLKHTLEDGWVLMIVPAGSGHTFINVKFKKIFGILKRKDIDNVTKEKMINDLKEVGSEIVKWIIYNFDENEYLPLLEKINE